MAGRRSTKPWDVVEAAESLEQSTRAFLDPVLDLWLRIPSYEQVRHLSDEEFAVQLRLLKEDTARCLASLASQAAADRQRAVAHLRPSPRVRDALGYTGRFEIDDCHSHFSYAKELEMDDKILEGMHRKVKKDLRSQTETLRPIRLSSSKVWEETKKGDSSTSNSSFSWLPPETKSTRKKMSSAPTKKASPRSKSQMFRAHPVPLHVTLPLYDHLVAKKAARSRKQRERRQLELLANEKPFSFWQRDWRTWPSRLTAFVEDDDEGDAEEVYEEPPPRPCRSPTFRAKAVPSHLFNARVKEKMHEEEMHRQLRRQLRAEELLKRSRLPPSMARREQTKSPLPPPSLSSVGGSGNGQAEQSRREEREGREENPREERSGRTEKSSLLVGNKGVERGRRFLKIPARPLSLSPPASYRILGDGHALPKHHCCRRKRSLSAPPVRASKPPPSPTSILAPGPSWLQGEMCRRREWARRLRGTREDVEKTLARLLNRRREWADRRRREWARQREAMMDRVWMSPTLIQRQGELSRSRHASRRWKAALDLACKEGSLPKKEIDREEVEEEEDNEEVEENEWEN